MTIDHTARHRLHRSLEGTLGEENAAVLMEHLPPSGWSDVATRSDLDHLHVVLRAEIRAETAELRAEMIRLGAELESQIGGLDGRIGGLDGRIGGLESQIGGLESQIGGLESQIGGLESQIGGLESQIGGLDGRIGGLDGRIGGLEATIYRLFNKMLLQLLGAMAGLLTVFFALTRAAG